MFMFKVNKMANDFKFNYQCTYLLICKVFSEGRKFWHRSVYGSYDTANVLNCKLYLIVAITPTIANNIRSNQIYPLQ